MSQQNDARAPFIKKMEKTRKLGTWPKDWVLDEL